MLLQAVVQAVVGCAHASGAVVSFSYQFLALLISLLA